MQKIVQKTMSKALSEVDQYLRKNRRRGELVNTGKRDKTFLARYLLDEILSTIKNQRISLSRAMIELPGYPLLLPGDSRAIGTSARPLPSHESIRQNILSEAMLIIEHE